MINHFTGTGGAVSLMWVCVYVFVYRDNSFLNEMIVHLASGMLVYIGSV